MSPEAEAEFYLAHDEGSLYRELYLEVFPNVGMAGGSDSQTSERGKKLFTSYLAKIRPSLCPKADSFISKCEGDPVQLAILVADVVAAALLGAPAIMISVLMVKIGLKEICRGHRVAS